MLSGTAEPPEFLCLTMGRCKHEKVVKRLIAVLSLTLHMNNWRFRRSPFRNNFGFTCESSVPEDLQFDAKCVYECKIIRNCVTYTSIYHLRTMVLRGLLNFISDGLISVFLLLLFCCLKYLLAVLLTLQPVFTHVCTSPVLALCLYYSCIKNLNERNFPVLNINWRRKLCV
jgi:hypothetical protein